MIALPTRWLRASYVLPLASASLCACGGGDSPTPVNPDSSDTIPAVASIEMSPADQIYLDSLGFVLHTGANAYDKNGSPVDNSGKAASRYTWSSSTPTVARVDQQGFITAVGWGTATITAARSGGAAGTIRLVVQDAVHLGWSLPLSPKISAGVTIGRDGTIYVLSKDRLFAVSPKGGTLWTFNVSTNLLNVFGTPAIGDDGTLYFVSLASQGIAAVRPDGSLLWQRELTKPNHEIGSSVALGPDGTIYAAADDSLLYAVDPRGNVKWTYHGTDRFFYSSPSVASDGTIYVGAGDGSLHAVNPDGTRKWIYQTASALIQSSPSIGNDGAIYFGAFDGRLYAVNPNGTPRWKSGAIGSGLGTPTFYGSPAIAPDGTIYVHTDRLFAINPDGTIRWSSTHGSIQIDPVVGADGTVYSASPLGAVYAFDAQGRLKWDYTVGSYPDARIAGPLAIGADGSIYATTDAGMLWSLVETDSKNGGYSGAPWPKVRGDRANSGRSGAR